MQKYQVFEAQEEIRCRKWLHFVDADNEQQAIEKARSEYSEPIDCGELGEPDYADSGFVARSNPADEDGVWEMAVTDLATRKESPAYYIQEALTQILTLAPKGANDQDLAAIASHCRDALACLGRSGR